MMMECPIPQRDAELRVPLGRLSKVQPTHLFSWRNIDFLLLIRVHDVAAYPPTRNDQESDR